MNSYCNSINDIVFEDIRKEVKRKSYNKFGIMRTEADKRARREIANNNERRRMKSINSGFETLRRILPFGKDNDKLSKAAILQTTAKYVCELVERINKLENEVKQLKEMNECNDRSSSESLHLISSNYSSTEKLAQIDTPIETQCTNNLVSQSTSVNDNTIVLINQQSNDITLPQSLELSVASSSSSSSSSSISTTTQSLSSQSTASIDSIQLHSLSNIHQKKLEHLLAAVEEVERIEAAAEQQNNMVFDNSQELPELMLNPVSPQKALTSTVTLSNANLMIMKPTISPYTEEIMHTNVSSSIPFHLTYHNNNNTPHHQFYTNPTSTTLLRNLDLLTQQNIPLFTTQSSLSSSSTFSPNSSLNSSSLSSLSYTNKKAEILLTLNNNNNNNDNNLLITDSSNLTHSTH